MWRVYSSASAAGAARLLPVPGARHHPLLRPQICAARSHLHLWVEDFMAIVTMDAHSQSLQQNVFEKSKARLAAMKA
jgi:hypothetical protein